jgi:uncharacterized membrane protein YphA (DoxX/SURF4 family)
MMSTTNLVGKWSSGSPQFQSLLRIVAAFLFMLSGTMKLFAFPAGMPPNGGAGEGKAVLSPAQGATE